MLFPSERPEKSWPLNPDRFTLTSSEFRYVEKTYFSHLVPGSPILMVTRFVQKVQTDVPGDGTKNVLETRYYLGFLSEKPLFRPTNRDLFIATTYFVSFPETGNPGSKDFVKYKKMIAIDRMAYAFTPLKEDFMPPQMGKGVRAFTVCCGRKSIERWIAEEAADPLTAMRDADDLAKRYVRAACRLGLPVVNRSLKAALAVVREELFVSIFRLDERVPREVLHLAHLYGLDRQMEPIRVDGTRYFPMLWIEDLKKRMSRI
jgi:hypothetical protein